MAIWLKRLKLIKRLTAGPNIVISAAAYDGFIASKEIDLYTVNSEWTKNAYIQDNPKLKGKISFWYAGIDENYWKIEKQTSSGDKLNFLFYLKRPVEILVSNCKNLIEQHGHNWQEIIYGNYTMDELKKKLKTTDIVIYFVEQESQGIAMFEIWATNTPTWHWDPEYWQYKMKNYKSSSAPYLTIDTGRKFRDEVEFDRLLNTDIKMESYKPRDWIIGNATDKLSSLNFLKTIEYENYR
jgi:hypothetical protein